MARKLGDMTESGGSNFPPPGRHLCRCVKAVAWTSPKKKTPAVLLTLATRDGDQFEDAVFMTARALWRLVLVSRRLCGMSADATVPDNDAEAAKFLARYIADNATGRDAIVTIEERDEVYIVTEGPDQGQKQTVKRRRVAAAGYATASAEQSIGEPTDDDNEQIPF